MRWALVVRRGPEVTAAAAHAAAHIVYTASAIDADGLGPAQRCCIEVFEDARVEFLAYSRFPGLRRLWLRFFEHALDHVDLTNARPVHLDAMLRCDVVDHPTRRDIDDNGSPAPPERVSNGKRDTALLTDGLAALIDYREAVGVGVERKAHVRADLADALAGATGSRGREVWGFPIESRRKRKGYSAA